MNFEGTWLFARKFKTHRELDIGVLCIGGLRSLGVGALGISALGDGVR